MSVLIPLRLRATLVSGMEVPMGVMNSKVRVLRVTGSIGQVM